MVILTRTSTMRVLKWASTFLASGIKDKNGTMRRKRKENRYEEVTAHT
jgi:hypothetical protein